MATTVSIRILAEISGYINPLKHAAQATKDFRTELAKAAKEDKLDAVASGAQRAGLALAGGFAAVNFAAARFEKQMSAVRAVTSASAADFEALSQAAIQAGKDTEFSATEAAQAEEELAKAGISTADILGGALRGSLDLAAAGSLDLADAATIAARSMNVFDLRGQDVAHIADVLAAGANKSAADVHQLGEALRMGGLAARNAGLSLEDTVGTLAAFHDNALIGSDAGTSLKTMLQMLANPSEEAADLMEELGIKVYDLQGNFIGVERLAGVLQTRLSGLTQEQRQAALATIFGADAMRAATVLMNEGEQGIREYITAVNDQGAAQEVAHTKTDNLVGDIERLTGSMETLAIQSGTGTNKGLRILAQSAEALVNQVGSLPGPIQTTAVAATGLAGVGLLFASMWIKGRQRMAEIVEQLAAMGPTGERAGRGLQTLTRFAGRAALAFGTLQVSAAALDAAFGSNIAPNAEMLADQLARFGRTGEFTEELERMIGDVPRLDDALKSLDTGVWSDMERGIAGTIEGFTGLGSVMDDSLQKSRERLAALDAALTQLVQAGRMQEAAAAFEQLARRGSQFGISVEELKKALPGYTGALYTAENAAKGQGDAAAKATGQNAGLTGALAAEEDQIENLIVDWERLHGKVMSADEAMLNAKESVAGLSQTFKDNKFAVEGNSLAALRNRVALQGAAKDAVGAAQSYLNLTGDSKGAARMMDQFRRDAIKATGATGAAKTQVQKLADQLFRLPETVKVNVGVNINIKGQAQLSRVSREIERLGGSAFYRWGGWTEHADRGLLRDARVFPPTYPARYAFAEPGTGGEAFVPKRGDYSRSMAILNHAAGWYGAQVTPRERGWYGGRGAGMGVHQLELSVSVAPGSDNKVVREIVENLRFQIRSRNGGDAQEFWGG